MAPDGKGPSHKGLLVRPRLNALIQAGIQHTAVVVLAGPGYGKTQAVTDYLNRCNEKTLWVRLCDLDNLSAYFWNHLLQMLEPEFSKLASNLKSLGFPDSISKFNAFSHFLFNTVGEGKPIIWVFDDFGEIHNQEVRGFFEMMLKFELPGFHLILISNNLADVNSVAYLSSKPFLILTDDLRFTKNEILELCRINGFTLGDKELDYAECYTEGWVFPLHLLVQKHKMTKQFYISDTQLSESIIFSLLEERFFAGYPPKQQKLLLQLSFLGFFTKEFMAKLYKGPAEELNFLKTNAFILNEPSTGRYFFHRLYRIFLQKKSHLLDEEEKRQVWREAAQYYEASGDFIDAVICYDKNGDHACMLNAIRDFVRLQHGMQAHGITSGNAAFFLEYLNRLTPEEIRRYPIADYFRALVYLNTLELEKAETLYIDLEQRLLKTGTPQALELLGDVYAMCGALHMMRRQENFGDYYKKACRYLPNGTNLQNTNSLLTQNINIFSLPDNQPGARERMERAFHDGIPWANKVLRGGSSGLEHIYSAEAAYLCCRLEEARQHAYRAIYKAEFNAQHDIVCNGCFILAKTALLQGDLSEMTLQVKNIEKYAAEYGIGVLEDIRDTALGWYYVRLYDLKKVPRSIVDANYAERASLAHGRSLIVYALYQLLTGQHAKLVGMLENPVGLYMSQGIWQDHISRHLILAMAYHRLGNTDASIKALWTAYDMTYHNGLIALFVDVGSKMKVLLDLAGQQDKYPFDPEWLDLIEKRSAEYGKRIDTLRALYRKQNPQKTVRDNPLTKREQEVLQAVARGLTREEIAAEQYVTLNTVKSTIRSIYNKLNANNKGDAVSIAISREYIEGYERK